MPDTYRIGIDVGGTSTDVVLVNDQSGAVHVAKLLTSHAERADTVVVAITRLLDQTGITSRDVAYISHGTTITTNAVIERKGAKTALTTNDGFRDILEIGRFARPPELIYRAHSDRPAPYVPRSRRLGIRGRIAADGSEVAALDTSDLHTLTETLRAAQIEAVAVCLLFSFLRPEHETAVRDHLATALPGVEIVTSSDILREFREYPRTSTTVFAAYVAPVLRRYVTGLVQQLAGSGITSPLYIFQSNGGVARPEVLMRNPSLTLVSGPAGAVVGAVQLCGPAGFPDLITGINCSHSAAASAVQFAVKIITDPENPPNAGSYRPIKLLTRPGTLVDAQPPSSMVGFGDVAYRVMDATLAALAPAIGAKAIASGSGSTGTVVVSGHNGDHYFTTIKLASGAHDARTFADRVNTMRYWVGNAGSIPIEVDELNNPLRFESFEIVADSGGGGPGSSVAATAYSGCSVCWRTRRAAACAPTATRRHHLDWPAASRVGAPAT